MSNMDRWDVLLLIGAGFAAVVALIQLMLARRDEILRTLKADFEAEQQRKRDEERKTKQREADKKRRKAA
jgi:hypothetical protein